MAGMHHLLSRHGWEHYVLSRDSDVQEWYLRALLTATGCATLTTTRKKTTTTQQEKMTTTTTTKQQEADDDHEEEEAAKANNGRGRRPVGMDKSE